VYLTIPDISYNPTKGRYFAIWYKQPSPTFYGRFLNDDGSFDGGVFAVTTYASYDALGIARNSVSNTYMVVTHDNSTPEDVGVELNSSGTFLSAFRITSTSSLPQGRSPGNFNPRVASHTARAEWLMATNHIFQMLVGQRAQTLTRDGGGNPPPTQPPPTTYMLTLARSGAGTIMAGGLSCGTNCSGSFPAGAQISLSTSPGAGYVFAGYTGDADCLEGSVTMDAAKSCGAKFNRILGSADSLAVDLDGDGAGDLAIYNSVLGTWFLAHNDQANDFAFAGGHWSEGWQIIPAALNTDSLLDLLLYNPTTGQWYQALNNGPGGFTYSTGEWSPGWNVRVGRFNRDTLDEVLLYDAASGVAYQVWANGTGGFTTYLREQWAPGSVPYLGDFNADGLRDVFLYSPATGAWTRYLSNGHGGFTSWAGTWSPGWTITVTDFTGDRADDLFLYNDATGQWFTCITTATGLTYYSGQWSPGWVIHEARLDTDARYDLFLYNPASGDWFEGLTTGPGTFRYIGGHWDPGWQFDVTEFNGDGPNDLFLYNLTTGAWFKVYSNGSGGFSYAGGAWSPGWTVIAGR
jgi:hypothetical protein